MTAMAERERCFPSVIILSAASSGIKVLLDKSDIYYKIIKPLPEWKRHPPQCLLRATPLLIPQHQLRPFTGRQANFRS